MSREPDKLTNTPQSPRAAVVDNKALISSAEQGQVGITDPDGRGKALRYLWIIALAAAIFCAIAISITGQAQRGELWSMFKEVLDQGPKFDLVESRNGVVLMTRIDKNYSEVVIQRAGEVGWRYISTDDLTAKNPALSLSGTQVAYLSERGEAHIVVTSLISESQKIVTAKPLTPTISSRPSTPTTRNVCKWSKARWSPDEYRLALFVCVPNSKVSYAAVTDLRFDPPQIAWLEEVGVPQDGRSAIWLDANHLTIVTPSSDKDKTTVNTVEVP